MSNHIETRSIPAGTIAWQWNHGEAPTPLVMLHGLGDSSIETFAPLFADSMLKDEPTLFIDLPGFGHAEAEEDFDARMDSYAALVRDHLRFLDIMPRAVIGHSMGGTIAIELAQLAPDLVPNLIVGEALLVPDNSVMATSITKRSEEQFMERGLEMLQRATQRQASRGDVSSAAFVPVLKMANPVSMYRASASLVENRDTSYADMLANLSMPRTFLIGEYTEADTKGVEETGVNLVRIPETGHAMIVEQPEASFRAIKNALTKSGSD